MLMNGLDGQITTAVVAGSASAARKSGCARAVAAPWNDQLVHRRLAAPTHEILLEVDPAFVGANARAHRIVAHRQHARSPRQGARTDPR